MYINYFFKLEPTVFLCVKDNKTKIITYYKFVDMFIVRLFIPRLQTVIQYICNYTEGKF